MVELDAKWVWPGGTGTLSGWSSRKHRLGALVAELWVYFCGVEAFQSAGDLSGPKRKKSFFSVAYFLPTQGYKDRTV